MNFVVFGVFRVFELCHIYVEYFRWPIYFFGTSSIAWIPESKLILFTNLDQKEGIPSLPKIKARKGNHLVRFKEALFEIANEPFQNFQFKNSAKGEEEMIKFLKGEKCERSETAWDVAFPLPNLETTPRTK